MSKTHAENLFVSFLWLMITGYAFSSCAASGLRTVTPPNAPPDVSYRMPADEQLVHQGISIGGEGYVGQEIAAPADGVVILVNVRGDHVRIQHGQDSNKVEIYTDHFHVHGLLIKEGDKVKRGQAIGLIGAGKNHRLPHYHYVVTKEKSPRKFIPLNLNDYWFGIDQYKEKLGKGLDVGPFVISCFDPNVNYPKEPIRFTYPAKCK